MFAVRPSARSSSTTTDPADVGADVDAVTAVLTALSGTTTSADAVRIALQAVRDAFGWAYGSHWAIDPTDGLLHFSSDSGTVSEEFQRVTLAATFARGVGLSGRAWAARELVFVPDLGQVHDCVRAPVAQRVGVRSGVCFPIVADGEVVGTMDFFATETLDLSDRRLATLRCIGILVSQALERFAVAEVQGHNAQAVIGGVLTEQVAVTRAILA